MKNDVPKNTTQSVVIAALLASLICVATMMIKIPSPLHGYLNLGDCIVLLSGWMLPPMYGFLAAGLGSALADCFSGYVMYFPITFVIKGLMALIAFYVFKTMNKAVGNFRARIIGGVAAEIVMISGYFVFESFLYGFAPALLNVTANGVQGLAGLFFGLILIKSFEKYKVTF